MKKSHLTPTEKFAYLHLAMVFELMAQCHYAGIGNFKEIAAIGKRAEVSSNEYEAFLKGGTPPNWMIDLS